MTQPKLPDGPALGQPQSAQSRWCADAVSLAMKVRLLALEGSSAVHPFSQTDAKVGVSLLFWHAQVFLPWNERPLRAASDFAAAFASDPEAAAWQLREFAQAWAAEGEDPDGPIAKDAPRFDWQERADCGD